MVPKLLLFIPFFFLLSICSSAHQPTYFPVTLHTCNQLLPAHLLPFLPPAPSVFVNPLTNYAQTFIIFHLQLQLSQLSIGARNMNLLAFSTFLCPLGFSATMWIMTLLLPQPWPSVHAMFPTSLRWYPHMMLTIWPLRGKESQEMCTERYARIKNLSCNTNERRVLRIR